VVDGVPGVPEGTVPGGGIKPEGVVPGSPVDFEVVCPFPTLVNPPVVAPK